MVLKNGLLSAATVSLILMGAGCTNGNQQVNSNNDTMEKQVPAAIKEKQEEQEQEIKVTYTSWPLKGVDTAVSAFKKKFSAEEQCVILALNRLDAASIKRADTLIIPDKIPTAFMEYSPFPRNLAALKDIHKMVVFSYPLQAFAAYENGQLVYSGPTSMGSKSHPTPTGLFFANWKAEETISTVDDEWKLKWNFNIENKEGVGWHQYAMPGFPASHSCLRMLENDAKWMYGWANQWIVKGENEVLAQGTPVVVFGAYPFGSRRPWLHLLDDAKANQITQEALTKELSPFLQRAAEQQQRRAAVENNQATEPAKKM